MSALLFPGQGSQIVGMGLEFFQKFKIVKNIFKQADENLGFSLSKIILEGPEDQLQLTKHAQPAILTVSYSIFKVLKEEFNFNFKEFKYFAGHSLGEYSALVCSNSLKFNDALFLLFERGKAMQEAVPVGKGGMLAILGAPIEKIEEIIKKNKSEGICEIANDNADGQVIISGDKESVDNFNDINALTTLIDICDFVITVSNTNAHISGALGKKTFLLLPKGKGKLWYWSSENNKSNWYPSIEVIEQSVIGSWESVIHNLTETLKSNLIERYY